MGDAKLHSFLTPQGCCKAVLTSPHVKDCNQGLRKRRGWPLLDSRRWFIGSTQQFRMYALNRRDGPWARYIPEVYTPRGPCRRWVMSEYHGSMWGFSEKLKYLYKMWPSLPQPLSLKVTVVGLLKITAETFWACTQHLSKILLCQFHTRAFSCLQQSDVFPHSGGSSGSWRPSLKAGNNWNERKR